MVDNTNKGNDILSVLDFVFGDRTIDTKILVGAFNARGIEYRLGDRKYYHRNEPTVPLDKDIVSGIGKEIAAANPDIWANYHRQYQLLGNQSSAQSSSAPSPAASPSASQPPPSATAPNTAGGSAPHKKKIHWNMVGKALGSIAILGTVLALGVYGVKSAINYFTGERPAAASTTEETATLSGEEESMVLSEKRTSGCSDLENKLESAQYAINRLTVQAAQYKLQLKKQEEVSGQREGYIAADRVFTDAQLQEKENALGALQEKYAGLEAQLNVTQIFSRIAGRLCVSETETLAESNAYLTYELIKARQEISDISRSCSGWCNEALDKLDFALQDVENELAMCSKYVLEHPSAPSLPPIISPPVAIPVIIEVSDAEKRYLTIKDGNGASIRKTIINYLDGVDGTYDWTGEMSFPVTRRESREMICVEALANLYTAMTGEYGKKDKSSRERFVEAALKMCGEINPEDENFRFKLSN